MSDLEDQPSLFSKFVKGVRSVTYTPYFDYVSHIRRYIQNDFDTAIE
jgi:hypothetical protein